MGVLVFYKQIHLAFNKNFSHYNFLKYCVYTGIRVSIRHPKKHFAAILANCRGVTFQKKLATFGHLLLFSPIFLILLEYYNE